MKTSLTLVGIFCVSICPAAGGLRKGELDMSKVPALSAHYKPKFTLDTNTDAEGWTRQQPGLHAAFKSTDELCLRCEVPGGGEATWEVTGWKGERLNAQVAGLAAERDYAKRDFDSVKLSETIEQGKKLIETLSLELTK